MKTLAKLGYGTTILVGAVSSAVLSYQLFKLVRKSDLLRNKPIVAMSDLSNHTGAYVHVSGTVQLANDDSDVALVTEHSTDPCVVRENLKIRVVEHLSKQSQKRHVKGETGSKSLAVMDLRTRGRAVQTGTSNENVSGSHVVDEDVMAVDRKTVNWVLQDASGGRVKIEFPAPRFVPDWQLHVTSEQFTPSTAKQGVNSLTREVGYRYIERVLKVGQVVHVFGQVRKENELGAENKTLVLGMPVWSGLFDVVTPVMKPMIVTCNSPTSLGLNVDSAAKRILVGLLCSGTVTLIALGFCAKSLISDSSASLISDSSAPVRL